MGPQLTETNRSFALQSMLSALELFAKEVDVVQKVVSGESPMQYSVVDWHRTFIKVLFGILIVGEANQKGMLSSTSRVQTTLVLKDLNRVYTWKEVQDWIAFVQTGDECTVGLQLGLFKGADWEAITRPSFDTIPMREVLFHLRSVLETFEARASSVGLLYEQILQVVPEWDEMSQCYKVSVRPDSLRKSTGAFYTPQTLVDVVLNSTIEPLLERCLSLQEPLESIRELAICDPSCGLGYILIAAAKRLTRGVLRLNPSVDESDTYTFILKHCMYGVDINPLTIDMCKALLWMEAGDSSISVGTWDDKIRCGHALLGCTPAMVKEGITEASFVRVLHHDDRTIRRKIASKSRSERRRLVVKSDEEANVDSRKLADTLMASMVWPKIDEGDWYEHAPTFQVFERLRQGVVDPILQQLVERLKVKHRFFHWHLEFPTIVARGGFDAVIGNPPFLDSEFLKRTVPYERTAIGNLYESTTGNWDLYIPFIELSLRILKPSGFHAFVTPNKIIGSDYAISLQQHCLLTNKIREVHDFSRLFLFGKVRITVVVVAIQKVSSVASDIVQFYQYEQGLSLL